MARYTGSAATGAAMLTAISTAAQLQGWTEEERYTEGDNSYDVLVLSSPAGFYYYLGFNSTDDYFNLELSKSYTLSIGWDSIPDKSGANSKCRGFKLAPLGLGFPLVSHAIFASSTELHIAMETSAGKFRYISFGQIEKLDAAHWVGGEYICGSNPSENQTLGAETCLLFDSDANAQSNGTGVIRYEGGPHGDYYAFGNNALGGSGGVAYGTATRQNGGGLFCDVMNLAHPNTFNSRVRYFPVMVAITDSGVVGPSTTTIPLGYVKNMRAVNCRFLTLKEEDPNYPDYFVFPTIERSDDYEINPITSRYEGYAFKQ